MGQPFHDVRLSDAAGDLLLEAFDLIRQRLPAQFGGSVPVRIHSTDATDGVGQK